MKIRQAVQGDIDVLSSLILCSAPITLAAIFDVTSELSALNFLRSSLLAADGQYGYANHWVAEVDNQVVGCVSPWQSNLASSFHQATLQQLTGFYGMAHTLSVVQASQALQDCIPKPQAHEWCIGHFSVLKIHQRKGIGTALLAVMQQQAVDSEKSVVCLDVDISNVSAIDFYLRHGFVKTSESEVSQRMRALGIGSHWHLSKSLI